MEQRLAREEIRQLVNSLIREVVPQVPKSGEGNVAMVTNALSGRVREALQNGGNIEVILANDQDLNDFAREVALCAMERDLLGAIASNRVRFRFAKGGRHSAGSPIRGRQDSGSDGVFHCEAGLLGESKISEIGRAHSQLTLGPKAVLTPLAWDRAREMKLEVVRKK